MLADEALGLECFGHVQQAAQKGVNGIEFRMQETGHVVVLLGVSCACNAAFVAAHSAAVARESARSSPARSASRQMSKDAQTAQRKSRRPSAAFDFGFLALSTHSIPTMCVPP